MNKTFTFEAILEEVRFNFITTAVFLPHHIIVELPKGKLRATGLLNGIPFSVSILYRKDTGRYFPISAALRKLVGVEAGDKVTVSFRIIEFEKIDFSLEFDSLPDEKDKLSRVLKRITTSINQALSDYITNAKRIDMRIRKAFEMVKRGKAAVRQPQGARRKKSG